MAGAKYRGDLAVGEGRHQQAHTAVAQLMYKQAASQQGQQAALSYARRRRRRPSAQDEIEHAQGDIRQLFAEQEFQAGDRRDVQVDDRAQPFHAPRRGR